MTKQESPLQQLNAYLPDGAFDGVVKYITEHKVHLTITRERTTVLGDYRNKHLNRNHRISVNGNLNKYSFLITLLHELGHLLTFEKYGNKIPAHGAQWKNEFGKILAGFISVKIFPQDIEKELLQTLKNPAASSCAEASLLRILRKYDPHKPGVFLLEELPEKSFFKVKSGKVFSKGNRIRKRFLCQDMTTQKMFLFSPVAEVELVK
ncbi:MAG: SprT-like domain-containing protein [Bacteroidota bacterium]|nr:SprT-like domain-containing protein [Bacteroidota bacterium]